MRYGPRLALTANPVGVESSSSRGGVLDGRPIQELAASLCEQRLHFAAQIGIGVGQQRRALFGGALPCRVE